MGTIFRKDKEIGKESYNAGKRNTGTRFYASG